MHHCAVNVWTRTLPLPQYFLVYVTFVYSMTVGIGTTISTVAFNETWKRGTLVHAAIYSIVMAIVWTTKEHGRRKRLINPGDDAQRVHS